MSEERLIVSVSGVRGKIGTTLTAEVAFEFGAAFGTYLGAGRKVALGRDSRPSGSMIQNAVVAGLLSCGVDVVSLGIVTTPGVALMTRLLEADGGIIITASHNPHPYNGIKFLQPSGVALRAADAAKLKSLWESKKFATQQGLDVAVETVNNRTHPMHIDAVCAVTDVTGISSRRYKVVLDSINGAGCVVSPMLLSKLGCEVVHINGEPNGQFAHTPEPIEENLTDLCNAVRKHKADVGFAQDPDADRLVVVDENGKFVGEEYTLAMVVAFVLQKRKGDVAVNLSTSRMVDDLAGEAGVQIFRSPTGEANVVELMEKTGCIFGGEGNGGVIDPRVVPVRDSLVGMAAILQYMSDTGKTVSQLIAEIPAYHLMKTKLPCSPEAAAKVTELTREEFAGDDGAKFNDEDGLRIDFADRWLSVRGSNTEPIMRIFAEAPTAAAAAELVARVKTIADRVVGG
ncbi:MAG: phosphoglucosamine mutase [Phycisphaerae bacterium]|nr:phosphoglucosamine mutase [Phycisphaerae bacterium]